jgi:hypothetical protein
MEDRTYTAGAPTNGDQSINATSPASKKDTRRKSPSALELYKMMYVGDVSSKDLKNLRIGEPREIPVKLVAYLRQRMNGAASRVASIKNRLGEYSQTIRNRSALSLTQSDVDGYRAKKLKARAELIEASDEYRMFQQFYEEALEANSVPSKHKIVTAKEDAFAERMAPSKAKRVIEILTAASTNGKAEDVEQLRLIASGPREAFRERFVAVIHSLDECLSEEFTKRPKLLTRVIGRVADHYQSNKE